ncbi:7208_t:CDS:2 [Dentiscutata erythropus]|uniref:7208_t:CDS:1 n=1 Tax=Dentiscutata erythropus TaxID=1348616 RepID=A0A9N8WDL6_9GLOM|nr:7208_t:CDS:2 [Dentiscutata erythropus]
MINFSQDIILKYNNIYLNEVSEEICTCTTLFKYLEKDENCKQDRTIRLKIDEIKFEILYIEGASPIIKGKKPQEDVKKLQQLVKLNLDKVFHNIQYHYEEK